MGELFAPEVRERCSGLSVTFNWLMATIVTQAYGHVSMALGAAIPFWIFALVLVMVMTFCLFFVPETKGKTLSEIQQIFRCDSDQVNLLNADVAYV